MRMRIRERSLDVWLKTKNAKEFDKQMNLSLKILKFLTRLNHYHIKLAEQGVSKSITNKITRYF